MRWRARGIVAVIALAGLTSLIVTTLRSQHALPQTLSAPGEDGAPHLLTREGIPIHRGTVDGWNVDRVVPLESVPLLLREAIVAAEDKRFWRHGGADWRARAAAVWQNLAAGRAVRGASTISEQVVRLLHPRPRTLWSRWVEGFEAMRLEARFSKAQVLEFYLNQVPYSANRRGVAQAADYYFGRDLETLSAQEILCLAVVVRAPSALDPLRDAEAAKGAIARLARRLDSLGEPPVEAAGLRLRSGQDPPGSVWAPHFRRAVLSRPGAGTPGSKLVRTTLDGNLQRQVEHLAFERLSDLSRLGVEDIAVLVVDLDGNQVRAWVSASAGARRIEGLDAVSTPRQPGSTLKPLLYAMALDRGWTPDTMIEDRRLAERVGHGQHVYSNYSQVHYGQVSVREALGNSLNIPAVLTLQFVGADQFLSGLRRLGMESLSAHPNFYGDGLALGNGEVSLAELAQAYAALARNGAVQPLALVEGMAENAEPPLLSPSAARSIRTILSDDTARYLEFGNGGVLRFPHDVAVKTGTSSDYHDAWTLAFNRDYLVAVWAGNLERRETNGVSGAIGPALLARSIFARLPVTASRPAKVDGDRSASAGVVSAATAPTGAAREGREPEWISPFDGLVIALDPRVPDAHAVLKLEVSSPGNSRRYRWSVDGRLLAETEEPFVQWNAVRGMHKAAVSPVLQNGEPGPESTVSFQVR